MTASSCGPKAWCHRRPCAPLRLPPACTCSYTLLRPGPPARPATAFDAWQRATSAASMDLGDSRRLSSLDDLGKLDAITVRAQHPLRSAHASALCC